MLQKLSIGLGVLSVSVATPILIKEWSINKYAGKENLENKTVIVTGANSGMGLKLSEELARRKAKVIMACRDDDECIFHRRKIVNETGNGKVYCSKLDLASLDSVREFVDRINQKVGKVDILVNNAAVMRTKKRLLTKEGFEMQLGVNHLGHFLLTNLLEDNLKREDTPARVLNVTCTDYKNAEINFNDINWDKSFDTSKAFKQSKLANILFTHELALKLKDTKVNVFTIRPPNCRTKIKRHLGYYNSMFAFIPKGFFWILEYSAPQGAESILHACLSPELDDKRWSGKLFHNGTEEKPRLPSDYPVQSKKLWLISQKWTRLEGQKQRLQTKNQSETSKKDSQTAQPVSQKENEEIKR